MLKIIDQSPGAPSASRRMQAYVVVDDELTNTRIRVEIAAGSASASKDARVTVSIAEPGQPFAARQTLVIVGAVTLPEPETIRVGVVFGRNFNSPQEAAQCAQAGFEKVFHYKALESLKLTIGDKVRAPIGTPNDPITRDHRDGVVVTFTPKPTGFFIRTIEERA